MTILQKVALSRRQVTKGCSLFAASALAGSVFSASNSCTYSLAE